MEKKVVKVNLIGVVLRIVKVQVVKMKANIKIYVNDLSKSIYIYIYKIKAINN